MNELLTKLKRLFEPRPRTPAEPIGEPTSDRPPPAAAEPPPVEAVPRAEAPQPPVEAAPFREPASIDVDELAEVRAALEAVAEVPVTGPQPEAPRSEAAEPEPAEPAAEALPPAPDPAPAHAPAPAPASAPPPDALVLTLGTPPATFTVAKTSATLGRGQENTIRLDDLSVSRRHARIAYRQGGYWLSDLGSMGGTWVDGTRLNAPRRIAAGEVIDIGLCRLTVSFAGRDLRAEPNKSASKPRSEMAAQVKRRR